MRLARCCILAAVLALVVLSSARLRAQDAEAPAVEPATEPASPPEPTREEASANKGSTGETPPPTAPVTEPGSSEDGSPEAELPPITVLPRLLTRTEAVFPASALQAGIESAAVVLEIDVDAAGGVEAVTVLTPSAHPGYGFEDAAVAAVYSFEFSPAVAGEEPVPVRVQYRYEFFLKPAVPAAEATTDQADDAPVVPKPPAEPVVNFQGLLVVRGVRSPIPGVVVTVFQGEVTAPDVAFESTTDAEGRFEFFDLVPGQWKVLIQADGFYPVRTAELIEAGARTEVKYYVEAGDYNPLDVLVEAVRPRKEVNRTSLSIQELERIPGSNGDVLNVVQNLPGVSRSPFFGEIIVRGSAPEDTRTLLEGMELPFIYHFGGLRSVVPTSMLEGIDFYPGNFSPEFGRATGGILDVRLARLQPEGVGGQLDVSILDTSLYLEAPLGDKASIAISGRRSYLDFIIDAVASAVDSDSLNVVVAPRYYDGQLLLKYRPLPGHAIRLFGLFSDDRLELLFNNPGEASLTLEGGDFETRTGFYRGIAEYEYTPSETLSNQLRVSLGSDQGRFKLFQFEADQHQESVQVRDSLSWRFAPDFALQLGVDHRSTRSDYDVTVPLPEPQPDGFGGDGGPPTDEPVIIDTNIDNFMSHSVGGFARLEATLLERLLLLPGLRYDYFSVTDAYRYAPRFSTRLSVNDQWVLKGGAGLFYQEPTLEETSMEFGNPALGPEEAQHYSAGVEYAPLEHLSLDVTGFYKLLDNLASPSDALIERDGALAAERYNNGGSGRVYGLEMMLRHKAYKHFNGWISYTLMRSERRDGPDDDLRLFSYDQTHILTALGTYELPRNWEIGFRWRLVSGLPTTPVIGSVYINDLDEYQPVRGEVNSDRIPAFHQLDIRVDKHWIHDAWRFSAYLDVQNVYNRTNPNTASYNFDYTEQSYSQSLPIVPIVGLRAEY